MTTKNTLVRAGILLAAAALSLTGCAAGAAPASQTPAAAVDVIAADTVEMTDAWVKAVDGGMSAAFGTLTNHGDADVTLVAAEAEVSPMIELHETVAGDAGQSVMRRVDGGFVIPASGTLTLEPGGSHLMLMGLTEPLVAGDELEITLTFSDDSTLVFAAPVKDFAGANEHYDGSGTGH